MKVLVSLLVSLGITAIAIGLGCGIGELIIAIENLLNKTILKQSNYNRTLERVKHNLGYNKEMIKFYKGEIDEVSPQYADEGGSDCCFKSWDYLKEIGIDEKLIEEGIRSEEEASEMYEIYSEKKRKEDIQSRIDFIEKELKDIKRRI